MLNKILIYDGDCAYCQGFVSLLNRFDSRHKVTAIKYDDKLAQQLLIAQFGTLFGFSMYLFEVESVSWGKEAAKRIVESLSFPKWLSSIAFRIYPKLVNLVSKLSGRSRKVCGPECFASKRATDDRMWVDITSECYDVMQKICSSLDVENGVMPG